MVTFLAGAHGVGKSFLGKPVADALSLRYATASALIREELGAPSWDSQKRVQGIDKNQEALIAAVVRIKANEGQLVLDGHFVLRDASGGLSPLPLGVFRRLGIKGCILLEAPVSVVYQRLADRAATQTLEDIEQLAVAEFEHAQRVCSELDVPLVRLHMPDDDQLRSAIKSLMR